MSKLVFRENNDEYDEPLIEVGNWWKRDDGLELFNTVLAIVPKKDCVRTDCGDAYYDYSISFDTILAVADKIKELRKDNK